jgi:drug/metabolite transporter (DMT)-like permease
MSAPPVTPAAPVLARTIRNRAILMMIGAILCFTLMDASAKALSDRVGVIPAVWARYCGQMAVVIVLIAPRLWRVVRTRYPRLQILRSILLASATAFFFVAISRIPLHEAASLMAINPAPLTLGAAVFLGESLGIRRIAGIAVALLGALIILRPGTELFQPAALFALGAAGCYSAYALLTRRVGPDEDVWTSLFYTGLVGSLILSAMIPFAWVTPDATGWALMAAVAAFGTLGQLLLIRAFSTGEAAMLAPYSYTGLVFAALWGMILFAEYPDAWTILGALVIAGAGIYVWHRETYRN